MAMDLDAIRRRISALNGVRQTSSVQLWKPDPGQYMVRGLPWKNATEGMPLVEKWFYYIGNNTILQPKQFGKPDPIDDLLKKLYSSGSPDDRVIAKKLRAKMRAYMPVLVRGQEDKGVMVWSLGKLVYTQVLGFFTDEDYNDILDPLEGFDLKIAITKTPGKQWPDTTVAPRAKSTKLHDDPKQAQAWLDAVPNLDDMYRLKSKEEIEKILNDWMNSDDPLSGDGGTPRGEEPSHPLDAVVADVKAATTAPNAPESKPAPAKKAVTKAKAIDVDDDQPPVKKQTLDEAFDELMK